MYSFESRVRYSEVDETGTLTLLGMMNYLQDCSTFHCESLGMGLDWLRERGMAWILGGWQIEIDGLPRFCDLITTSTFCYEMTRTQALRCFEIKDASGRSLVRADSQWFMYGFEQGRAIRIPDDQRPYLEETPRLAMGEPERKIRAQGESEDASPITVTEQNLDTNHHVNNAQYVLFALEALEELGHEASLERLSVQYRKMAWLGDVVYPHIYAAGGGWIVAICDAEGGTYATVKLASGAAKEA